MIASRENGRRNGMVAAAAFALAMSLAGVHPVRLQAQDSTSKVTLTKKQLKDLIANAKEPADHEKLAAYYRQEAAQLRQDSKDHQAAAKIYSNVGATKPGVANGAPHCDKLAQLDSEEANEADGLAKMHEEMAKGSEQK